MFLCVRTNGTRCHPITTDDVHVHAYRHASYAKSELLLLFVLTLIVVTVWAVISENAILKKLTPKIRRVEFVFLYCCYHTLPETTDHSSFLSFVEPTHSCPRYWSRLCVLVTCVVFFRRIVCSIPDPQLIERDGS